MNNGRAEHFRTLMQSYFDEMKALAIAAKTVGLSGLSDTEQNRIIFGLVEVMVQTSLEVDCEFANEDRAASSHLRMMNGGRA